MALVVNTNISSLTAQRNVINNTQKLNSSLEKLASGYRINRAADDAAGLSISENLRTQIRGNAQAINNAQDGVNLLQVAEGGMQVITENIQRIRELTVQGASDVNTTNERKAIVMEINERLKDIDRIANTLKFNKVELLTGNSSTAVLQIGANSAASTNALTVGQVLKRSTASALGFSLNMMTVGANGIMSSGSAARVFLGTIDTALQSIFTKRSQIGAYQNRLNSTIESLSIAKENLTASDSRIRDLDIASESANMTKAQILQQAAVNVLAQANQSPQLALSLLRG